LGHPDNVSMATSFADFKLFSLTLSNLGELLKIVIKPKNEEKNENELPSLVTVVVEFKSKNLRL
jgi:hypothetical protein